MAESEQKPDSVWRTFGAVVLSIAAILVSIRSCVISNRALSLSQTSFVTTSRPYILVSPYKPAEWDSYIKFTSTPEGTQIAIAFRIKNAGDTPAHAIRLDDANIEIHFRDASGDDITERARLDLTLVQPEGLTIGPNERYQMEVHLAVNDIGNQTSRMRDLLDRGAELPVEIHVSYDAILGEKTTRHTSVTKALLYKHRAVILASEVR